MSLLPDDLSQTPVFHVQVTIPADLIASSVDLRLYSPSGTSPCRAIRWLGSGGAILRYTPATPRTKFTTQEIADGVDEYPRNAIPAVFAAQYEERSVQAIAIDAESTAGVWEVTY